MEQERLQKDKLQQLSLKLTRMLKMQRGSKDNKNALDLMLGQQYQTYDGRQAQRMKQSFPASTGSATNSSTHIQIHNLSHLYHSNQFYSVPTSGPAQ